LSIQVGGRETFLSQVDGVHARGLSPETSDALAFYGVDPFAPADLKSKPQAFTYLFTPSYKITPDVMAYVRLASGFRPGGANNPAEGVPATFAPDKTKDYEVGLKADFLDQKLTIDASLYYIKWTAIQFTITNSTDTAFYVGNAGQAKAQGLELSAELQPVEDLRLSAWIDVAKAVFTTAPQSVLDAGTFLEPGYRLPFSERFAAHAAIDKSFKVSDRVRGFVRGDFAYVGSQLGPLTSSATRQLYPSYVKLDLLVGFSVENWTANAYANNLTDERGLTGGGIGTLTPTYFRYLTPRTIGLTIARTF
jgi:outer membrane receptor protein involved in Fe transport